MRYSQLAGQTLMQPPKDADTRNAELLTQAGFARKLAAGIYSYLPMGRRVLDKIESIICEEMDAIDGQKISMPAMVPLANWQTTGRDHVDVGFRTMGANDREFILGWSHEEVVTPLLKEFINSYRDLPLSVYQIQTKFRNEPRAKSGVLRGREFSMKDMYSFHRDQEDLEAYYDRSKVAYMNVFNRCGLDAYMVEASGGAFSDKKSHEFAVVTDAGEDTIIVYEGTDKAENLEVAEAYVGHKNPDEAEVEMGEVEVNYENGATIASNAEHHGVPEWKILKTVVYKVDDGFLGVVIRGDLNVSIDRIKKELGAENVRSAKPKELEQLGLVMGFISPVGNEKIPFVGDESVATVKNWVTGANKENVDLVGVNLGRDFTLKEITHLAELDEAAICKAAGCDAKVYKAIEAGNIFQLDSVYSDAFGLKYTDEDGKEQPIIMGCYGIGVTRLLGTIVEVHNDEHGIIWPKSVTPYHVHLVSLGNSEEVEDAAEAVYEELSDAGYDVLYDDRDERAGKKFNDADLIGIPVRVVVSERNLKEGQYEWKLRSEDEALQVPKDDLVTKLDEYYYAE